MAHEMHVNVVLVDVSSHMGRFENWMKILNTAHAGCFREIILRE